MDLQSDVYSFDNCIKQLTVCFISLIIFYSTLFSDPAMEHNVGQTSAQADPRNEVEGCNTGHPSGACTNVHVRKEMPRRQECHCQTQCDTPKPHPERPHTGSQSVGHDARAVQCDEGRRDREHGGAGGRKCHQLTVWCQVHHSGQGP